MQGHLPRNLLTTLLLRTRPRLSCILHDLGIKRSSRPWSIVNAEAGRAGAGFRVHQNRLPDGRLWAVAPFLLYYDHRISSYPPHGVRKGVLKHEYEVQQESSQKIVGNKPSQRRCAKRAPATYLCCPVIRERFLKPSIVMRAEI